MLIFHSQKGRPSVRPPSPFSLSELERRELLAGDGGAGLSVAFDAADVVGEPSEFRQLESVAKDTSIARPRTLVFVDSQVDNVEQIMSGIAEDATMILLEPSNSPLRQMTQAIAAAGPIASVHVISHGRRGAIELSGRIVDLAALEQHQGELTQWRNGMIPGADLILYGCEVAEGEEGHQFLERLARLTGADVAASTNRTGASNKGGDWILETQIGDVESSLVLAKSFQAQYQHVMRSLSHALGWGNRPGSAFHGMTKYENVIAYQDFANTSQLRLNGTALSNGVGLELTQDHGGLGSAFAKKSLAITSGTSFRTHFQFRIDGWDGTNGADGFVFTLQNSRDGSRALTMGGGEGLGYAGITRSLGIEFDTYKNSGDLNNNHVSVLVNGNVKHSVATRAVPFDLNSGKPIHAWIEYDAGSKILSVYVSENVVRPASPLLKTRVDLEKIVGSKAFAGFTAATGSLVNRHEILDWRLDVRQPMHVDNVDAILEWNEVLLKANAVDHSGNSEQVGPVLTARAFAMVSTAMHDAYNSIHAIGTAGYHKARWTYGANSDAAVAQAAHDVLAALFPSQKGIFASELQETLARIPNGHGESAGRKIGAEVARKILAARANDPLDQFNDPSYVGKSVPGFHNVDPLHPYQGFYGSGAAKLKPFVIDDVRQFGGRVLDDGTAAGRLAFLSSPEYTAAFQRVKDLGGDGVTTPTLRSEEQTVIGIYWGYDGRPGLGTPPRLYNQIVREIALQEGNSEGENARLFALVNLAMADAGLASWGTKYEQNFWRPVLGVRGGDADGNPQTNGDANWNPLGAPASNPEVPSSHFTPPFPAYTSGHATFGAAMFETLEKFYGRDDIGFSFVSDEFNGITRDSQGNVRPRIERHFTSFTQAKIENAESRIYLGIHWDFDASEGIKTGDAVAQAVYAKALRPYR
jgi:hypothetical protein